MDPSSAPPTLARDVRSPDDPSYVPSPTAPATLPAAVDLRPPAWPVWAQDHLNACTSHAVAAAISLLELKENVASPIAPSRLFLYYNERVLERDVAANAPALMRDAFRAVAKYGVCPEEAWPYVPANFATKPSPEAYALAKAHRTIRHHALDQDLNRMKTCLAEGYPFTVGINVYLGFYASATTASGDIPMPDLSREVRLGGHAILVVGYDDARQVFVFRNSFGESWGAGGYGTLPYAFATNPDLSDSLFVVTYAD